MNPSLSTPMPERRGFLQSAVGVGATAMVTSGQIPAVHADGDEVIRVGLIGCGARGAGAASQALNADPRVQLTAIADAFEDRLKLGLQSLQNKQELASKIDVPPERQFVGFDAYKGLLACNVDVVLLTSPPHFRPAHLAAAIEAGKHVFAEKPCAVDTPGVHSVIKSCEEAKRKKLSVVSGLCLRFDAGYREAIRRIHDGAIGKVHTLFANDYRGPIWVKPREPEWTDMLWQMRNWYYFTWLSGDFNVEQHVHNLDVCAWIKQDEYPIKAIGMGGREVRKGPEYGNIFDHHGVVYEYADGTRVVSNTRQIDGCKNDISVSCMGATGSALISERKNGLKIQGPRNWTYTEEAKNMYQVEHDELFASIRNQMPINNGEYMAKSTLMAIMGRMATYTGQEVSWKQAWDSKQDLTPPHYEWRELETPSIAIPGVTRLT